MHYLKLETCIQQYEVRRFVQFYQIHIVWNVHQKAEHFCLKYKMVPMTCPMWHWMISTPVASSDSDFHQAIGYEPREDGTLCTSKMSKSNFRNYFKLWNFQNFEFFKTNRIMEWSCFISLWRINQFNFIIWTSRFFFLFKNWNNENEFLRGFKYLAFCCETEELFAHLKTWHNVNINKKYMGCCNAFPSYVTENIVRIRYIAFIIVTIIATIWMYNF